MMKVLYFSKTSEIGPSSRYRIYQYLPSLRSQGLEVAVRPLFGPAYFWLLQLRPLWVGVCAKAVYAFATFLSRASDLLLAGPADLIVIEGQLFPYLGLMAERLLARRYKVVVEMDDAIYLTYRHDRKIPDLLRLSSGAIVGNRTLATYARSFASQVCVVPTVVDTDRFRPLGMPKHTQCRSASDVITIGWIGLGYNIFYLESLLPVLQKLARAHSICVRVISSRQPNLPGIHADFRQWQYETEVTDLQTCHIGVMPLPDDEWARSKCGLKLLQYMAVGLPTVSSPVGVNREIISEGVNGYLASTHEMWFEKLDRLCRDVELRGLVGRAAVQTVVQEYSLQVWGPRLAECYRAVAEGADLAGFSQTYSGATLPSRRQKSAQL